MNMAIIQLEAAVSVKLDNAADDMHTSVKSKRNAESVELIPKGKPKSGRIWKNQRQRFSTIIKSKGIKKPFEKNKALREELARVKEASRAIIAAKKEEKEKKKERRRENLKRQEENRKKSEVVQVITNTSKLKKMKRKHLREVEKRDTNTM